MSIKLDKFEVEEREGGRLCHRRPPATGPPLQAPRRAGGRRTRRAEAWQDEAVEAAGRQLVRHCSSFKRFVSSSHAV